MNQQDMSQQDMNQPDMKDSTTMAENTRIIWTCEGRTEQRIALLKEAYHRQDVDQITVIHRYSEGRSGAETFLLDVDTLRAIAKFDHPYSLRNELCAYGNREECVDESQQGIVERTPEQHRAILKNYAFPADESAVEEGILIYSFQGGRRTEFVDSLARYFEKHDGHKSAAVIEKIVLEFLDIWWTNRLNQPPSPNIGSYSEGYDHLLPVQFELVPIDNQPTRTTLQSGYISRQLVEGRKKDEVVELSGFTITSTRNDRELSVQKSALRR